MKLMTFFCFGVHDNERGDKIKRPQNDLTRTIIAVRFWCLESSGIVEYDSGKQLQLRKLKISQLSSQLKLYLE